MKNNFTFVTIERKGTGKTCGFSLFASFDTYVGTLIALKDTM